MKEASDITAPVSTERGTELRDATPLQKRKINSESNKPAKYITMSKTPVNKTSGMNHRSNSEIEESELYEDELTLSPELTKLERILSRKQAASLEGIKNDIKLLLENEELIKKQQDAIEE